MLDQPNVMLVRALILGLAACAMMAVAPQMRSDAAPNPDLDARLTELKDKTAALVASALARLNALSPQERLSAPPEIWRVPGALTEFRDCAECPHMVVIPAGEFTMGSPPAEQNAETQHRVTIAKP